VICAVYDDAGESATHRHLQAMYVGGHRPGHRNLGVACAAAVQTGEAEGGGEAQVGGEEAQVDVLMLVAVTASEVSAEEEVLVERCTRDWGEAAGHPRLSP